MCQSTFLDLNISIYLSNIVFGSLKGAEFMKECVFVWIVLIKRLDCSDVKFLDFAIMVSINRVISAEHVAVMNLLEGVISSQVLWIVEAKNCKWCDFSWKKTILPFPKISSCIFFVKASVIFFSTSINVRKSWSLQNSFDRQKVPKNAFPYDLSQ